MLSSLLVALAAVAATAAAAGAQVSSTALAPPQVIQEGLAPGPASRAEDHVRERRHGRTRPDLFAAVRLSAARARSLSAAQDPGPAARRVSAGRLHPRRGLACRRSASEPAVRRFSQRVGAPVRQGLRGRLGRIPPERRGAVPGSDPGPQDGDPLDQVPRAGLWRRPFARDDMGRLGRRVSRRARRRSAATHRIWSRSPPPRPWSPTRPPATVSAGLSDQTRARWPGTACSTSQRSPTRRAPRTARSVATTPMRRSGASSAVSPLPARRPGWPPRVRSPTSAPRRCRCCSSSETTTGFPVPYQQTLEMAEKTEDRRRRPRSHRPPGTSTTA